ncbi:hypothetical protein G6027_04870 [Dietzia sp. SLG310A2-38A2]|uniref:hypothetical protein n=1 Tax=Dietzia sp. SLG310A2-38A2 TaxID=1630643 RepID=UPI0015F8E811|nr:hypothetical protein [Dietzia sp. SLG310A2-38A2]MBB1030227.1 hypothetical protein [Dietzia sp. SLG310A2-38A2]
MEEVGHVPEGFHTLARTMERLPDLWHTFDDQINIPHKRPSTAWSDCTANRRYASEWSQTPFDNLFTQAVMSLSHSFDQIRGAAASVPAPRVAYAFYANIRVAVVAASRTAWVLGEADQRERLRRHLTLELEGTESRRAILELDGGEDVQSARRIEAARRFAEDQGFIVENGRKIRGRATTVVKSHADQAMSEAKPSETARAAFVFRALDLPDGLRSGLYSLLSEVVHDRPLLAGFGSLKFQGQSRAGFSTGTISAELDRVAMLTILGGYAAYTTGISTLAYTGGNSDRFRGEGALILRDWRGYFSG